VTEDKQERFHKKPYRCHPGRRHAGDDALWRFVTGYSGILIGQPMKHRKDIASDVYHIVIER
jgi:hypothetical protein